jgi:hypothetical protein
MQHEVDAGFVEHPELVAYPGVPHAVGRHVVDHRLNILL